MEACRNLAAGVPWKTAGISTSKGCGSAMRVAPIGLYYQDLDRVADVARWSSLLTHGHPAAIEGAATAAILVAMALPEQHPRKCTPKSIGGVPHNAKNLPQPGGNCPKHFLNLPKPY